MTIFFFFTMFAHAGEPWLEVTDASSFDQVVAVSDIHGNKASLIELLIKANVIDSALNLTSIKTLLLVVGDSIQAGDDSLGVLDFLISLRSKMQNQNGKLIHLLGNHEARRLSLVKPRPELQAELDSRGMTFGEFISPNSQYGKFLNDMPLAVKVSDVLFGHAGDMESTSLNELVKKYPRFSTPEDYSLLSHAVSPVESENWIFDQFRLKNVITFMKNEGLNTLVFGHQRRAMGEAYMNDISEVTLSNTRLVNIDTNGNGLLLWNKSSPGQPLSLWKSSALYINSSKTNPTQALGICDLLLM